MKNSIIAQDKYPLDLSQAYVHKSVKGAIFSIFYTILTILITIGLIIRHFMHPNTRNFEQIFGFDENTIKLNFNSMYVSGTLTSKDLTKEQLSNIMQYLTFGLQTRDYDNNGIQIEILHFENDNESQDAKINFYLDLKNEYFQSHETNYPQISLQTCQSIQEYSTRIPLTIIDKDNYLKTCLNDTNTLYELEYLKTAKFLFSYEIPFHSVSQNLQITDSLKTYEILFKIHNNIHLNYKTKLIKIAIAKDEGIFPSNKKKLYCNWNYPEQSTFNSVSYSIKEFFLILAFDSYEDDSVFFYSLKRVSLLAAAIDIGAVIKILELLRLIPYLWNIYYVQRAFVSLVFYYKGYDKQQNAFPLLDNSGEDMLKEEKSVDKSSVLFLGNINKMSYCRWICITCCCFSKSLQTQRRRKKKALSSLDKTVFIKFDSSNKWVDIKRYLQ